MAADFHTHLPLRGRAGIALVSLPYPVAPEDAKRYEKYSLEFHPWYLPAQKEPLPSGLAEALRSATALGEVGLDRLRGPDFAVQTAYLKELLDLAEVLGKPVVFHVVRAWQELSSVTAGYTFRKLVHGFQGSPDKLQALLEQGFYVSLSPRVFSVPGMTAALKQADWSRLGFESDDSGIPVQETLALAERLLDRTDLEELTDAAFRHFTGE